MKQATQSFNNRIAIVFDFDKTLTPDDSFLVLLKDCQIDIDSFMNNRLEPLVADGWEKSLAKAHCLIKESQQRKETEKITQSKLSALGKKLKLYDETEAIFERLAKRAKAIDIDIELEFYLISGGFVEIARSTSIAKYFKQIWGCEFYYNNQGEIEFIKRHMTHVEKTRYLYYLSKGLDKENERDLIYNYQDFPVENLHVPLNQVIYVGDGSSDIPCFTVINQYGGIALGIYPQTQTAQQWKYLEDINSSQRLSNLVPADYRESSELMRSLELAIDSIAKKIALLKLN